MINNKKSDTHIVSQLSHYGADDGIRTHEILEPQSSALGLLATSAMAGDTRFELVSTVLETAALPLN